VAASAIQKVVDAAHVPSKVRRDALTEIRIRLDEAEKKLKD